MSTLELQEENNRLKDQLSNLQKELNNTRKQLLELKQQKKKSPLSSIQRSKSVKNISNIEQSTIPTHSIKNVLLAKLNPSSKSTTSLNSNAFKKYETMLKIGVDMAGVITQMNKDNIDIKLIDSFKESHGVKTDSNSNNNIDLSSPKFSKYNRMKKLKIPMKTILNKMKQDGLTQLEIDVFSGKTINGSSSLTNDPLIIASQLGLPCKPSIPKPVNQMKRVHWTPVNLSQIKTSIWDAINHKWFDYDPIMFELNFQTRKRKDKINTLVLQGNVGDNDEKKDENKKNEIIYFVESKRSQMIQIGLRSFNMTNEQLRDTILSLDEQKLTVGHLSTLIDIVPTPEEQIQAEKASENGEISNFGVVERFFYSVYDIVELKQRVTKWLFKRQFMDRCHELEEQLDIINAGKMTILRSSNLREIFSIILAFGNHMNYGNKKGNAYGFHLEGLNLLPQIKTTDNSMTFPMFIWAFIKKTYPKLTRILQEFESVSEASRCSVDVIEKEYKTLLNQIKEIKSMINRYNEEYFELIDLEDMFLNQMNKFVIIGEKKINTLKIKMDNLHKSQKQLIKFFAYDNKDNENDNSNTITINSILKDVDSFIQMLNISKIKIKQLEKETKKQQMRLERRLNKRKKKRANTEHLTRQRFQQLLDNKKEKDGTDKKDKKDRRHRHKRRHKHGKLHDKYKQMKREENKENKEDEIGDGILQIETITLGDAINKKSGSRSSKLFDRTKHSSFELFKRSHSKKKNIRFRDKNENNNDDNNDRKHKRKQTQDDNALDNYVNNKLFAEINIDSDNDDEMDTKLNPNLFKSQSMHGLHTANDISLPKHEISDKKDVGQVDSSRVQKVRFDDNGNVHNVSITENKLETKVETENNDSDNDNDNDNEMDEIRDRPRISLFAPDINRRNSDPGTPLIIINDLKSRISIEPSLSLKSNSFEEILPGDDRDDDIDDILCVVEDNNSNESNNSNNSNNNYNKKNDVVTIDRTENIRISIKKNNKKKNVKIVKNDKGNNKKKGNKKKKKNKDKNKNGKKIDKSTQKRPKSSKAANALTASFF